MSRPFEPIGRFFRELKRRNVYRVAVTYLAVAFVGLQAVALLIPATTLPPWTDQLLLALLIVGFPIALVIAWAFEITPEGIRRSPEAERAGDAEHEIRGPDDGDESLHPRSATTALVWIGGLALALVGTWYLMGSGGRDEITDRSIAVLPFESIGQGETSAFTDGIHGDLLTRLSRIADLRVTSRTSVMRYRNPEGPLPKIAQELGVAWILRGEVQQTNSRVKVQARLVSASEDRQVWADSYERELTAENLFAIQEEITGEIVQKLQAHLSPVERRQIATRPTESLEAYRLYVRGRSLLDQQTETDIRRASVWFQRTIQEDSSYALAWSGLADALLYLAEYGYAPADSVVPPAREAVERALTLDPTSAEAHASRAFLQAAEGNGPALIRELEQAIALRPSYAQARSLLGWYYPVLGRPADGLASALRATETDPFAPEAWVNVALGWLTTGHPDSAIGPARRTRQLQGDFSAAPFYEALALFQLNRLEEAEALLEGIELAWAPPAPRTTEALIRLQAGDTSRVRILLDSLPTSRESLFYRGLLQAALGDSDVAFASFQRIDGWETTPLLGWPNVSLRYLYPRTLGPLREDPRYAALLAEIDRSWGMTEEGAP